MNKFNLLIIVLAAVLSCKTKIDTSKENHPSLDFNAELEKASGRSVTYYRNLQLDSIVNTLIKNDTIGTTLGKSSENVPYLITVRTKPGLVEIHEQMDDIAIIRSGHGILKTGYQVAGKIRASGEEPWRNWFCDTIKSATDQKLSPGDFIIIPAMAAHQYIPNSGDTLTYWTIKVKHLKNIK
jgi:mannose-6-phosphate isomerase-like protein (cupin superfamily)